MTDSNLLKDAFSTTAPISAGQSQPFSLTSIQITLGGASSANILQTTADVSVVSNSGTGTLYAAIRTDRQWIPGDESSIISGTGDWAGNSTPLIGSNTLNAVGLNVARTQYLGFVQTDGTNQSALATGEFITTAYPVGQEAPYQLNSYPQYINYQNVPVHADLMYSWGGDDPKSITVGGLPTGLSMDTDGIVSGISTTVENRTVTVTVQNGAGSATTSFNWRIYSYSDVVVPVDGMTRAELVAACIAYADRYSDTEVIANMDAILRFAEDRMSRMMQVREMSRRAAIPLFADQEFYDLPADFAGLRDINLQLVDGPALTLEYLNPMQITHRGNYPVDGCKRYYTIIGNQFRLLGAGDGDLEITYYQRVPYLIEDDDSNWVLVNHKDIYRNAVMAEIEAFTKNDDRASMYDQVLNRAFDEIALRDQKDRWGGTPMTMRAG